MQKVFLIGMLLCLIACAHKSIVTGSKIKGSNIINVNWPTDTAIPLTSKSILINSVSLEKFAQKDDIRNLGTFYIFLATDKLFIEATLIKKISDSITLEGSICDKSKNDTIDFSLKYNYKNIQYTIQKNNNSDFSIQLLDKDNDQKDGTSLLFTIDKSQNFILQANVLELLSGEITNPNKKTFKYLIINDPEKFSEYLKSVCILTIVDKEELEEECKRAYLRKCENGYNADVRYSFSWKKRIYCECK